MGAHACFLSVQYLPGFMLGPVCSTSHLILMALASHFAEILVISGGQVAASGFESASV